MKIRIKSYIPGGQKTYKKTYYIEVKRFLFWRKHFYNSDLFYRGLFEFGSIKEAKKYAVKYWGSSVEIEASYD